MRKKKAFFWHLYPYFLFIALLSVAAVTWFTYRAMYEFYLGQITSMLRSRVAMASVAFSQGNYELEPAVVDRFCDRLGRASQTRFTFILPSGKVIGDTEKDPKTMDNHSDRPEIIQAMEEGYGRSKRFSFTLHKEMMYVAMPLSKNGKILAIVRAAIPVQSMASVLRGPRKTVIVGSLFILMLAGLASFFISRRITRPIAQMQQVTQAISKGELDNRVPIGGPDEIEKLGRAINKMVEVLRKRIQKVTEQRNQLEAIFSSMVEGVIGLDKEERVTSFNKAACDMLGLRYDEAIGRPIQELIRAKQFQDLIDETRESKGTAEKNLTLNINGEDKILKARGTKVSSDAAQGSGSLLVLSDITNISRLEEIRKEFVANVSHELKTPITAIKGALETLQEVGGQGDGEFSRFLEMIRRNADRLESIVEDLLTLSRLEQDEIRAQAPMKQTSLNQVIESAMAACSVTARARNITLRAHCEEALTIAVNEKLLEQALINLLDNAIKYGDSGTTVTVEAEGIENEVEIRVRDQGPGIAHHHLPRIFERFYRVDKARSRARGGTGLGLAIVKHVAQLHGGRVNVTSKVGEGSTFSIILPS